MTPSSVDSLETLSPPELVGLVRRLLGEVERLRKENEKLTAALAAAKLEIEQLKDEIRRLKGLPPRPPIKPSGMEKATDCPASEKPSQADATPPRRRGPGVSKLSIDRTVTLTVSAPAGSRYKGYEEIIVQDIAFRPEVTLYRRERWTTPDGRTMTADLPAGVMGGCGPHLQRMVLMLYIQGQMTCERIVTLLTAAGLAISKRQVVRLLTARLDLFRAEEEAIFSAGLRASAYVSVDDTGARHAGKACYTTQFGSDRFTAFRTGPSKSRLAFLRNLLGGTARYAINAAAVAYMRAANLAHGVIDALSGANVLEFAGEAEWSAHLLALGLTELQVTPDPVRVASEGALWGAICAEGRLGSAVILLRRRRTVPRRRPRSVLGSRRASRPQARSRQRPAAQRRRGHPADDLVVLSPAQGVQGRPQPPTRRRTQSPLRPHLQAPNRLRDVGQPPQAPSRKQG